MPAQDHDDDETQANHDRERRDQLHIVNLVVADLHVVVEAVGQGQLFVHLGEDGVGEYHFLVFL